MTTQYLTLGSCTVGLRSTNKRVQTYWKWLFADWLRPLANEADAILNVEVVEPHPFGRDDEPYFVDKRTQILEAYHLEQGRILLHFFQGGVFEISADRRTVTGTITNAIFDSGVIDDITLVTLSAFLRTQGIYTLHASGVTYQDQAVLFVGQSFSGKTTTCLNLALNGWGLLANDVVLLQAVEGKIVALPLPDIVSLRPKTVELLPQLKTILPETHPTREMTFHAGEVTRYQWADPAPVTRLCFPKIGATSEHQSAPQLSAIALARLLEESLDAWDLQAIAAHTRFLSTLTAQAASYDVTLGSHVANFPNWFATSIF